MESEFYITHKNRIIRSIKLALPHYKRVLAQYYGQKFADQVILEMVEGFEEQLSTLPYIGGFRNKLTTNLYQGAALLVLCKTLKQYGKDKEEIGKIIVLGTEAFYRSFPLNFLLRLQGKTFLAKYGMKKRYEEAQKSQLRQYAGDWVYQIVEGDESGFVFGVDYTECGLVKYFRSQDALEFLPYLCQLDYPMCEGMHIGLDRTLTIAQGGEKCNFRFVKL